MLYRFYIKRMSDEDWRNPKEDWILLSLQSIYKVENNEGYKTLYYHVSNTGYHYVNVLISDEDLNSVFSILPQRQGHQVITGVQL